MINSLFRKPDKAVKLNMKWTREIDLIEKIEKNTLSQLSKYLSGNLFGLSFHSFQYIKPHLH